MLVASSNSSTPLTTAQLSDPDRSGPYGPWHQVAPPRRNPCFVIPLKLAPAAPLMYHD